MLCSHIKCFRLVAWFSSTLASLTLLNLVRSRRILENSSIAQLKDFVKINVQFHTQFCSNWLIQASECPEFSYGEDWKFQLGLFPNITILILRQSVELLIADTSVSQILCLEGIGHSMGLLLSFIIASQHKSLICRFQQRIYVFWMALGSDHILFVSLTLS